MGTVKCLLLIGFMLTGKVYCQGLSGNEEERRYLEKRVFEKIDSLRQRKRRPALEYDSILYKAALNQAEYISEKGKLSHTQTGNSEFKNPQSRAEYYGAVDYFVGENVLWTDYNKRLTSNNGKLFDGKKLEDLAEAIFTIWKESQEHYKNLMDERYTLSALAIVFDPKAERVYACQVFAYTVE